MENNIENENKKFFKVKLKGGLCNKLFHLFSACEIAINKNLKIIDPIFGWKNEILFSEIYDIDYFNDKIKNYNNGNILIIKNNNLDDLNIIECNIDLWNYSQKNLRIMRKKNEIKYNSMMCIILNSLKINKKYEFIVNKYNIKNALHLRIESDWIKYTNKDKYAYIDINNIIKFYIESEIFYNKIFFTSGENQIEISENFKNNNIEFSYFFDINYEYELNAAINFEILVNSEKFIGITRSTYSNLITIKRSLNNNNNNYIYNLNNKIIKRVDKGLHCDENSSILSNVILI
jgi:hypothetical protein